MLLKSKTNSGAAASPKSSMPMPVSGVDDAKAAMAMTMTDEATSRATAAAVAKAKEVIHSGGTQAEAAAAAREVARRVLKEMMQASSIAGEGMSDSSNRDENANANQSLQASPALELESNLPVGTKYETRKGRSGGMSPLISRNAGSRGLLSKFRKKMKTGKEKKMKSVPEETTMQKVGNANDTDTVVVIHAIEDNRDEVELMPIAQKQNLAILDETPIGNDDRDEREVTSQNETSAAANDVAASEEKESPPRPQLQLKSSSETSRSDSTYCSTFDDMDSYDSERVHHPRASYYIKDWREVDEKDSFTSDVNILDAMLNMEGFMDALDEVLFPVGTKQEGATRKNEASKLSNNVDYEEDQGNCSVWKLITCRGGCSTQDSHYESSVGYSDIVESGESIQSDIVDSGIRSSSDNIVAHASAHNVEPNVSVSSSASASLTQKEDGNVVKHGKSVSWADSMTGRHDNRAPDASITKKNAKPTSQANESGADAASSSRAQNRCQTKTISKINDVSTSSTALSQKSNEIPNKAEEHDTINMSSTTSKLQSEEDSTVADDSIASKMKILLRNTMTKNPIWGAAKAANQCYFPTGGGDAAINPEMTVIASTGNDDFPNWRDSVVDTVQTTTPRSVNGNIERSQIHHIQQQHLIYTPGQGFFQQQQQQQQILSQYQRSGGFYPTSPSSRNPHGVGFQNNHVPPPLSPQRFSPVNNPHQGIFYQTSNGDGVQLQNHSQGAGYEVGQHHPRISGVLPRINSNLSLLSAEDKEDRYAGVEQQQGIEQYDQTVVNPGPYHSPVMGSSAVGGYGNASLTHLGLNSQQGHYGTESRGPVGGNVVCNIGNDNVGYPNTIMSPRYNGIDGQDISPQTMGLNSLGPNLYAYHLQQQQQQMELHHNQPRQQLVMENRQQYMQPPMAYQ